MKALIETLSYSNLTLKSKTLVLGAFCINLNSSEINYENILKNNLHNLIELSEDSLELIQLIDEIKSKKIKYKLLVEFNPPTKQDLIDYVISNELMMNKSIAAISDKAEDFLNYYGSNGWKVGKAKNPMVSWRRSFSLFITRDYGTDKKPGQIESSVSAYLMLKQKRKKNDSNENN